MLSGKRKKFYARLRDIGLTVYSILLYAVRYRRMRALSSLREGIIECPLRSEVTDHQYISIFPRLLKSFDAAKRQQLNVPGPYQIGRYWQENVDKDFSELGECIRDRNVSKLRRILENVHRERCASGLGGAYFDYVRLKRNRFYKYQFVNTWYKYYNIYKEMMGHPAELSYPDVGNPVGLNVSGQVVPIEGIRHHYYAAEILSLLQDINDPVICEIGGGLGGLALKVCSDARHPLTYIILDIPEVLLLASYVLMTTFPEKKVLLYGDEPFGIGALSEYEIILMPNFMFPELQDKTVHLFFNANSFSEMKKETVEEYVSQIERVGRQYFMHVNHNVKLQWPGGGKEEVNMIADDIHPSKDFKRIYKHPRVFARLEDEIFYLFGRGRHFAFLYERMNGTEREERRLRGGSSSA